MQNAIIFHKLVSTQMRAKVRVDSVLTQEWVQSMQTLMNVRIFKEEISSVERLVNEAHWYFIHKLAFSESYTLFHYEQSCVH